MDFRNSTRITCHNFSYFSIRLLLTLAFFFTILVVVSNVLQGLPMVETVRDASVLFGLAPSSLFLMIVVAYGVGAVRISNKVALVQQANSVESLCNVDVLCLDKTGTLTTNRINLEEIYSHEMAHSLDHTLGEDTLLEDTLRCLLGDFSASITGKNRTSEALLRACPGQERPLGER